MKMVIASLVILVTALIGGSLFVYSGLYNIGADIPHSQSVFALIGALRDRSIAAHARGINVPPLEDAALLAEGAEHYGAMCSGCHLAPGKTTSELRAGLYPQPPDLTKHLHADAAQMFWVIKHGVKLTAMPAWGTTHDDQAIWGLVAFIQRLPTLSVAQYKQLTASPEEHEHHD